MLEDPWAPLLARLASQGRLAPRAASPPAKRPYDAVEGPSANQPIGLAESHVAGAAVASVPNTEEIQLDDEE
jgi:hypothetical protein